VRVPGHAHQRLERLGRGTPEWRSWLRLVEATIAAVNDSAWDTVAPRLDPARPETAPLLAGAEIAVDRSLARRWVRRLLEAAAREGGPAAGSLGAAASALDPHEFLQAVVGQDTGALSHLAAGAGADPKVLAALGGLAAMPPLQACARRLAGQLPEAWSRGYCPLCGAWPVLAEVRGLAPSRRLRCARCGGDWRAEWLCCVYCGETDHARLGSLVSDSHGETRKVDTCAACRGYLKTVTTLEPSPADTVALEDLGTVDLDVAALERGYARPDRPGSLLGARLVDGRTRPARGPRWHRVGRPRP
jgi:FdhE protein